MVTPRFVSQIDTVANDLITPLVDRSVTDLLTRVTSPSVQVSAAPYPANPGTSRALNTVYQNLTGKPLYIGVSVTSTVDWAVLCGLTNSSNPPTVRVNPTQQVANNHMCITFIVLPNNYYKVFVGPGTPSIVEWAEWY